MVSGERCGEDMMQPGAELRVEKGRAEGEGHEVQKME